MQSKTPRLHFSEDELENRQVAKAAQKAERATDKADAAKAKLPKGNKLRTDEDKARERQEHLRFGKKDTSEPVADSRKKPQKPPSSLRQKELASGHHQSGSVKPAQSRIRFADTSQKIIPPGSRVPHTAVSAFSGSVHREIHKDEEDNVGVQAAHQSEELVEGTAHAIDHARYGKKLKDYNKASKLEEKADQANVNALYQQRKAKDPQAFSNPISRWQQKRHIRREYAAAKSASYRGGQTAATTGTLRTKVESAVTSIRRFFSQRQHGWEFCLVVGLLFILIVSLMQSCSTISSGILTGVAVTSWPAEDEEISKADAYYTKLEAQLQKEIEDYKRSHRDSDEFVCDIDEIGHDPTVLISYLCAKFEDFTFSEVKSEMDALFALQYDLSTWTETETRTITRTVSIGESIGSVVTSGYCSCSTCCGIWSGGPTASGVYPTADHTIAVDAYNPLVPMGSYIYMNGITYKVEDTGNFDRYGVDFDVYYDDHTTAWYHGHRTWEAYYMGGRGSSIDITSEEDVTISYITLTSRDLESIISGRMVEEETELYNIYIQTRGNRAFFSSPVDYSWSENVSGSYGYRYDAASNRVKSSSQLTIAVPSGTAVVSPMEGRVKSVSGSTITLEDEDGYEMKLIGCTGISVSAGMTVEKGQIIAWVRSGSLSIELKYQGTQLNPYFYLEL